MEILVDVSLQKYVITCSMYNKTNINKYFSAYLTFSRANLGVNTYKLTSNSRRDTTFKYKDVPFRANITVQYILHCCVTINITSIFTAAVNQAYPGLVITTMA